MNRAWYFLVLIAAHAVANAADIVLPADQDLIARRTHELCSGLDVPPKPSYAAAHEAFKRRLGDYYTRYQTSLYEVWKRSSSPEQYEKMRALADKMVDERIEELKKDPALAKQRCREAIAALSDPEAEAAIKRRVNDFERQLQEEKLRTGR